jgi:hypothetical protein
MIMNTRGGGGCPPIPASLKDCNAVPPCCRTYYISGAVDAVAALASGAVTLTPQDPFQGTEIVLSSTRTAPFFDITSVKVGSQPQTVANADAPTAGDVWSEVAVRSSMNLDPSWAGVSITFAFTNIDPLLPHDFRVTLFGNSVAGYQNY